MITSFENLCNDVQKHHSVFIQCTKGGAEVKRKERFLERVVLGSDLPGEAIPGQPLVEIAGQSRVLIENHLGVTVYECNEIHVKVCFGQVSICGSRLELARMTKNQLVITGQIDCVSLQRRKC
jgi:sporulation protein YqfC